MMRRLRPQSQRQASLTRFYTSFLVVFAALVLVVGCGDDDADETVAPPEVSAEEFRQELERADREVSQAFGQVFESGIDKLPSNAEVPQAVKEALEAAAEVEREAADRLDELEPPEDAQEAVDGLAEEAREQADTLAEAAEQEGLTAGELQQSFEEQNPEQYLSELEELGYLP